MGFKLTNNGEIVRLLERFTLLEAISHAEAKTYCDEIINVIKPLLNAESNDTSNSARDTTTVRKLMDETKIFARDLVGSNGKAIKDPAIAKGNARKYVQAVQKLLSTLDPKLNKSDFDKAFKQITDIVGSGNFDKGSIDKLRAATQSTWDALQALLTSLTSKSINNTTIKNGESLGILKAIYADLLKIKGMAEKAYTDSMGNGVALIQRAAKIYRDDKKEATLADFLNICKEQHNGPFGKELAAVKGDTETAVRDNVAKNTDWDKKFADSKNKEVFWQEYFDVVWGPELGKKIAALGQSFKQECEVFGFDKMANPFIRYLEKYLKIEKFNITKMPYTAIHNAVVRGRAISKNTLLIDKYPIQTTGFDLSPIHKADFFTKSESDIDTYFEALEDLKSFTDEWVTNLAPKADNITDPEIKNALKRLASNVGNASELAFAVLYNEAGDANSLIKGSAKVTNLANAKTLRPAAIVKKLMNLLDATNEAASKSWDAAATSALVANLMTAYPTSSPASQKVIAGYILVISEIYLTAADNNKLITNAKYKVGSDTLDKLAVSAADRATIKTDIAKYGTTMSASEALNLIDELAVKWGIKV